MMPARLGENVNGRPAAKRGFTMRQPQMPKGYLQRFKNLYDERSLS